MTEFLGFFPKIPLLFRSAFDYYRHGPPQPSWDLESYLIFMFMRSLTSEPQSIEAIQRLMSVPTRVISGDIMVKKLLLPNSLRKKSETYIDGILKDYDHVILDDWKSENIGNGLECEWVYVKEKEGNKNHYEKKIYDRVILYLHGGAYCVGSPRSYRMCTSRIAKFTKARLFVINYRISPQNQFPAALHDAITAYDYLINPPKDADFLPIDPKNIIIMGDSAGGGLTMATLLAIRDSKSAPLPGGAIVLSPWVDLTHSMPSLLDPITDKSDSVSSKSLHFLMSPAWEKYEQKSMELSEKIRLNVKNKPKFWHESLECKGHLHLYASNQGSAIPYVSPLLAESLGDLPPILIQGGDVEKLRDECIYLAFKASDPEKYSSPSYNAKPSKSLPYQTPTKVVLEIYEEMPHVFQLMWRNKSSNIALKRISQFVDQTLSGEETKEKESKFLHVTTKGEIIEGLRKDHYKVLEWKNIGIKHDALVKFCLAIPSDNNSNFTKLFVLYAILLLAILLLINLL